MKEAMSQKQTKGSWTEFAVKLIVMRDCWMLDRANLLKEIVWALLFVVQREYFSKPSPLLAKYMSLLSSLIRADISAG